MLLGKVPEASKEALTFQSCYEHTAFALFSAPSLSLVEAELYTTCGQET